MTTDVKISELPLATDIQGNELVPVVQNGVTVQTTASALTEGTVDLSQGFVIAAADPSLSGARLLTAGTNVTIVDGGPGNTIVINASGSSGPGLPINLSDSSTTTGALTSNKVAYAPSNVTRTLTAKLQDRVSIKDYGAVGDGNSHPLSDYYPSLAAAQVDFSFATSLTNEIDWAATQKAINTGAMAISCPAGTYLHDQTFTLRGLLNLVGDSTGIYSGGTTFRRTANVVGWQAIGQNITSPFLLMSRICCEGIVFDGNNLTADLWQMKACYEFYWTNCRFVNCTRRAIYASQLWDSRFINCTFNFVGSADGLFAGIEFISNEVGYEFTNNVYFYGCRSESNPGVHLSSVGNNASSYYFTDSKFESVNNQIDYLFKFNQATAVTFNSCWMYVSPTDFAGITWSSTSSVSIGTGTKTFTIATGLSNIPINRYIVAYSNADPTNWMSGYVTAYNSGTGSMSFTSDYTQGSGSASSWTLAPMHPGLIYATGSRIISGDIHGGNVGGTPPTATTFQKAFVHIDNTSVVDLDIDLLAGSDLLPACTFQSWTDTTTNTTPAAGIKTFTIATGLTIAANTVVYIMGRTFSTRTNWMIGIVVSYNSGTGLLTVHVDNQQFSGGAVTGWTITKFTSTPAVFTNMPTQDINANVRIGGGSQIFGFGLGTNLSTRQNDYESAFYRRYGTPKTTYRNMRTADEWYMGDITSDPTVVSGTTTNTGKFSFTLFDFARSAFYTPWYVSGSRELVLADTPFLLRNSLWWIDPVSPTYRESRIVGTYAFPPTNPSGVFDNNNMIWNSNPAAGRSAGWIMLDETQTDASGWAPFATISATTTPTLYSGQQNFAAQALTIIGSSASWNLNTQQSAFISLSATTTLNAPTNMVNGGTYILRVVQSGGSHTISFNSAYKFPSGSDPVITAANGAVDILTFVSDGTSLFGVAQQNFS